MTRFASAIDLRVIHRGYRQPAHWRVTGITLIRRINMRTCFICFSSCDHTVVTTLTGAHGFVVIDGRYRNPCSELMTRGTYIAGTNVSRVLVDSNHTIVTGFANTHRSDLVVIHRTGRNPCRVDMTGLAKIRRIDMRR